MELHELIKTKEFQTIIECPDEEIRAHGPIEQMMIRGCKALADEMKDAKKLDKEDMGA